MLDLFDELSAVTQALDKAKIPYALVGGLAYSLWVEVRATEDINLLIAPEDWPAMPKLLAPLGYEDLAGPMDFKGVRIRRLTKFIESGGKESRALVLDFLLADEPLRAGLANRVRIQRGNFSLYLAPPEVIIKMKQQRRSAKDLADIEGLKAIVAKDKGSTSAIKGKTIGKRKPLQSQRKRKK